MEFTFDIRGSLVPNTAIDCALEDFETAFMQSFEDSDSRVLIFESFTRYITDFQNTITTDFCLWIDGSFVTSKTNPRDLDMVVFVDIEHYKKHESIINSTFHAPKVEAFYPKIDAYVVAANNKVFELNRAYWYNTWTKTRPNRNNRTFPKGFIQIKLGLWDN